MNAQRATILAIADGIATVRIEAPSACASCAGRGVCGSARTLTLPAPPQARPGATVTLSLAESEFLRGMLLAYLLPAAAMLAGALLLAHAGDLAAIAGALCGLGGALIALRRFGRRIGCAPTFGHLEKPSGAAGGQGARSAGCETYQTDRRASEHRRTQPSGRAAGFSRSLFVSPPSGDVR